MIVVKGYVEKCSLVGNLRTQTTSYQCFTSNAVSQLRGEIRPTKAKIMALIVCEKHGRQSVVFTCPHVSAAVRNATPVEQMTLRTYTLEDLPEWFEVDCWFCRSCIEDFKLPESGKMLSGQVQETFDKILAGACPICFEEWQRKLDKED